MQQAAEAIESSHTIEHNMPGQSDLNRSGRSGRWGINATKKKSQALEISVQRIDRPVFADIKPRSSVYLQSAEKIANTAHLLTRSKRLIGLSKPRQTSSIPLPPISGSRTISGKGERTDALPAQRTKSAKPKGYRTHLPTGNMMTENTMFHVLVTQCGNVNQESNKYNKISVALAAGNKPAVQDFETRSRLIKRTVDGQPAATSTPVHADPTARQKNDASDPGASDSGTKMPVRAKHDASHCEARQQRDFCSDDSAIETESQGSEDKGRPERLKEDSNDEYYTDQRIAEWVLKVNSSLFLPGNDQLKSSKPAEELDEATIKIIYSGD